MKLKTMSRHTFLFTVALVLTVTGAMAGDGTVVGKSLIVDHGSDAERFDLVIVSEGYTTEQLASFATQAEAFSNFFLDTPPFSSNCSAINVWRIDVASAESGVDDPSDCEGGSGTAVNSIFDGTYCADGANRRLLRVNEAKVFGVLNDEVPGWDQALVLVNAPVYGGTGGQVAVAAVSGAYELVAMHEIGHAAFGLADEYPYWAGCDTDVDRDLHPSVEPAEANVTTVTDIAQLKWSSLVEDGTAIPTTENENCEACDPQSDPTPDDVVVGLYEGAHYYHCDGYRPEFNCMMRDFSPFCPVCTARILATLEPFQPDNTPPVCDANGPYVAECAGETTKVELDGSASSDVDCDELTYAWTGDFDEQTAEGVMPTVTYGELGDYEAGLEVNDGEASDECVADVTIEDTTVPAVTVPDDVNAECESPDGTAVELGDAQAADTCDPMPGVDNDAPDVFDLGDTTVIWTATDASGNMGSGEQIVTVEDTTPPRIVAPDDITEECEAPEGNDVDLGDPQVDDVCDASPTVENNGPGLFRLGETEVKWTVIDASDNSAADLQLVTIEDTTPPEITAPDDVTVECASPDGTPVDIGMATASDICDPNLETTNDAPDAYPLGETVVTWTATDSSGNFSTAEQIVTIEDTTPPEFSLSLDPTMLWPPNHKMNWITATISASDICDATPTVSLDSISSSEPDNGNGDGNTEPDIANADYGTDDRSFQVRAERSGGGDGRTYTVNFSVSDDSGNSTPRTDYVHVRHDQGNNN